MKCKVCKIGDLRVTHTISAGPSAETRDYVCSNCGARHSSTTFLIERKRKRGDGSRSLASEIKDGKIRVERDRDA